MTVGTVTVSGVIESSDVGWFDGWMVDSSYQLRKELGGKKYATAELGKNHAKRWRIMLGMDYAVGGIGVV